jgi:hypothetical protein
MPELGARRLAALLGALSVGVAAALANRVNLTRPATVALACLIVAGIGVLAIPSLRMPVTPGHGQLQSVGGAIVAALVVWFIIRVLVVNHTVESWLLAIAGAVFSLTVPAIHGVNAASLFGQQRQ